MPGQPTTCSSTTFTATIANTIGSVVTISFHLTQLTRVDLSRRGGLRLALVALAMLAVSCSKKTYEGHGIRWEPPRGVALQHELSEAYGVNLEFSGGVVVSVLDRKEHDLPAEIGEDGLDQLAEEVAPQGTKVISKRVGEVPAGKVARFVWSQGTDKTCLYYLVHGDQAVMLTLTAASSTFGTQESQFDLSLARLQLE